MAIAIDPQVEEAIREIADRELGRFDLKRVEIEAANDHDGDAAIWVTSVHGKNGAALELKALDSFASSVRAQLRILGETRFPYIRYNIPNDYKIAR